MSHTDDYIRNLCSELQQRGMTQADLAEQSGMSRQIVSQYITGKTIPRVDSLGVLAAGLHIPPAVLIMSPEDRAVWDLGVIVDAAHLQDDLMTIYDVKRRDPELYALIMTLFRKLAGKTPRPTNPTP